MNKGSHRVQKVLTARPQQGFQPTPSKGPSKLFVLHLELPKVEISGKNEANPCTELMNK